MENQAVNRAAIYVKSTARLGPEDADRETQMEQSLHFCKDHGVDVAVQYTDDTGGREEFERMMADATGERPPFDHVVVWKLKYFALTLDESVLCQDRLARNGIRLLSVKERMNEE